MRLAAAARPSIGCTSAIAQLFVVRIWRGCLFLSHRVRGLVRPRGVADFAERIGSLQSWGFPSPVILIYR
jgi:hypothetical protein